MESNQIETKIKKKSFYGAKSPFYLTPIQRKFLRELKDNKEDIEDKTTEENNTLKPIENKSKGINRKLNLHLKPKGNSHITNKTRIEINKKPKWKYNWAPSSLLKAKPNYAKYKNLQVLKPVKSASNKNMVPLTIKKFSTNNELDNELNQVNGISLKELNNTSTPVKDVNSKSNDEVNKVLETSFSSNNTTIGSEFSTPVKKCDASGSQNNICSIFLPSPVRTPLLSKKKRKRSNSELDDSIISNASSVKVPGTTRVKNLKMHLEARNSPQMIIDAGQKKFGPIQCKICGMVYSSNHLQDEEQHVRYHTRFLSQLRFKGWKKERTIETFSDGRIVKILPNDPHYAVKKTKEILSIVDSDLGFASSSRANTASYITYLYVTDKEQIVGCLVAESLSQAHKLQTKESSVWVSSERTYPCVVGVSRIWTYSLHRRQGVATKLMNTLRCNFALGPPLALNQIALSDPTPAGHKFASQYFKTDSFLVYNFNDIDKK